MSTGKKWEMKVFEDWKKSFPNGFIMRLPDQQSGYFGTSRNLSDFIAYNYPNFYIIETKSHQGNTFPLSCLTQYEKMIQYKGIKGVNIIVILWMIDHQKVFCIPIETFEKLKRDGKKSFNVKMEGDKEYLSIVIPSEIKRVYPICNYNILEEK